MTTATATMSALDQAKAYHDSIRSGEVTPAQLLEIFDWIVSAKSMLEAEISKKTIAELKKMVHSYHAKTKKDWVDAFYNAIRGECLLGTYSETFTYEMMMVRESPEEAFKKKIARERAHVEKTSPEAIAKHAAEVAERRAKHVAYANEVSKALENPQTIADFEHIKTYHKNGLASLTATQKALYDELHWTKGRETQEKAEVDKSKIEAFDLVDVEVTLHATKHTQKGHDLFVVTLSDWIERNDFEELCEIARRLSGYYSSYSAPGAIPGFTFKEEANARQFIEVFSNDISTADQRAERKRLAALGTKDRLIALAENMIAEADADLERPRLTNTVRRAGMAEAAFQRNYAQKALAKTLIAVSAVIGGTRHPLDGIRHRVHVETLALMIKRLQWAKPECEDINELVKDLTYPAMRLTRSDAVSAYHALKPLKNTVLVCNCLEKKIRATPTDGYVSFEDSTERDYAVKIFEKLGKQCPWFLAETVRLRRRLKRMNINCGVDLRHALRALYGQIAAPETITTKERLTLDLVGKDIPGFFPTPRALCEHLVELAEIPAGAKVAEPEAGKGDLADVIVEMHPEVDLTCVETQRCLVDILSIGHQKVIHGSWLDQTEKYDRIIMNPPFERDQDITHVLHAYECLMPNGRLVAIMSKGAVQRTIGEAVQFREWLKKVGASVTDNPEGSFLSSFVSTGVNTITVVVDRPTAA